MLLKILEIAVISRLFSRSCLPDEQSSARSPSTANAAMSGTRKTLMEVVASSFRRSKTVIYLAGKLNDFQEFPSPHVLYAMRENLGPYFKIIKAQASALHHSLFVLALVISVPRALYSSTVTYIGCSRADALLCYVSRKSDFRKKKEREREKGSAKARGYSREKSIARCTYRYAQTRVIQDI